MSDWYLRAPAGAATGPHPTGALLQWIAAGQVTGDHTVCPAGGSQWVPVTEVPAFLQALVARRGPQPSHPSAPPSGQHAAPSMAYAATQPPQPSGVFVPPSMPQPSSQQPPSTPAASRPSQVPGGSGRDQRTMAVPALMEAEVAAPSAAPPGPKGRTMLGQMAFESLGAGRTAVIGRTPGVDIVLPYPQVTGRHAGVSPTPDGMLIVVDYGSTNGTHVGGKRIGPNVPVKIKPGEKIFIGPYAIYLGLEGTTVRAWVDSDRADWSGNLVEIEALDLFLQVPDREEEARQKVLLDHVTFKAHPGDLIALMGPSGAGKTTLLTVLNGYLRPTSGEVRVNGESLYAIYDALRGSIGYVPQDDIVHPELTVFEAMALTPIALIPQVVLGGRMVPMTNKPWLGWVMALVPSRWAFEGLLAAERTELADGWKIHACVHAGTGIVGGRFDCALEELRNTAEGAGGLGFSTYDTPIVAFTVLEAMTVVCVIAVMLILKRRDSV